MGGKVYVFFNCNEEKTESTMNIFYNSVTYKDTPLSRKRLLQKVKTEFKNGIVKIAENDWAKIEELILKGNPEDASEFIRYGAIKAFKCV